MRLEGKLGDLPMVLKKLLGEIVSNMGFVTDEQLEQALKEQKKRFGKDRLPEWLKRASLVTRARLAKDKTPLLGKILTDMGLLSDDQLSIALKEQTEMSKVYGSLDSEKLGIAIEIGSVINSTLNLAEVLALIMTHANRVTNSAASTLMLMDDETCELVFSVPTGPKAEKLIDIRLPPGKGIAGWVAQNGQHVLVPDAKEDARHYPDIDKMSGIETKTLLCVPMKAKSKLIGVIEVINKVDDTSFTEEDALFLSIFASQAAIAIENARLYGELTDRLEDRQRAEAEKKKLESQLHRAEKMEVVGTLAGGVAHDLNNILSGFVSYPDLLLMQIPEDSKLRKPILTMQKSGEKAATIVEDLLTLARRGVITESVVNLNRIVADYIKSPEHQRIVSYHSDIDIRVDLEDDLQNLSGSFVHLGKTVMNLVSNAAEAISGKGEIVISTTNRYVDRPIDGYESVEEGDYVTLRVSDTGIGIPSKDLERIFEPFYTKKVMGRSGTGLGMTVVWGTVKDHKGYINVESTVGKGTVFTLYFPATRKEISREEVLLSMEDYLGEGESILVVDDVKEQREITLNMLTTLGYTAEAISSGEDAVVYLNENNVDLIILDMIMDPGIDGLDTYRKICEIREAQKTIIVSGFSETDRVLEAQSLGAGQYVRKPFSLRKIGIAVKTELERK